MPKDRAWLQYRLDNSAGGCRLLVDLNRRPKAEAQISTEVFVGRRRNGTSISHTSTRIVLMVSRVRA